MKIVNKLWGREVWIVNCEKYCGKILELSAGYICSYHYHKEKQETFYCLEGELILNVDGVDMPLVEGSEPITIYQNQRHSFRSTTGAKILEVSTEHSDDDVVREVGSSEFPSR